MRFHRRSQRGSQLAEALAIGIFILMITLALIDFIVLVLANTVNDEAVKNAARVAAAQADYFAALDAAKASLYRSKDKSKGFVKYIAMKSMRYEEHKMVTVQTQMAVSLPIPVPGIGTDFNFLAQATEPIVGH